MEKKNKLHIATYQRDIYNGVSVAQHLHNDLPAFEEDVVIRLGGSMPYKDFPIQVNSQEAVLNSINKLAQKKLLIDAGIATQPILDAAIYPCVIKGLQRSGGSAVFIVNNHKELREAAKAVNEQYYIEPLFNTTSEYRLHCTQKETFFAVKKHKRNKEDIIITRDNHFNKMDFIKPRRWKEIQAECVKAMKVLGLDIACFDVLYDSSNDLHHSFVISEANTNPELLANTYKAYLPQLVSLVEDKIKAIKKAEIKPKKAALPKLQVLTQDQKLVAIKAIMNDYYSIDGAVLEILIKK